MRLPACGCQCRAATVALLGPGFHRGGGKLQLHEQRPSYRRIVGRLQLHEQRPSCRRIDGRLQLHEQRPTYRRKDGRLQLPKEHPTYRRKDDRLQQHERRSSYRRTPVSSTYKRSRSDATTNAETVLDLIRQPNRCRHCERPQGARQSSHCIHALSLCMDASGDAGAPRLRADSKTMPSLRATTGSAAIQSSHSCPVTVHGCQRGRWRSQTARRQQNDAVIASDRRERGNPADRRSHPAPQCRAATVVLLDPGFHRGDDRLQVHK